MKEKNLSKKDEKVLPSIHYEKTSFGIGGDNLIIEKSGKVIFRYISDGAPPVEDSILTEEEKYNILNIFDKLPMDVYEKNSFPSVLDPTKGIVIKLIIDIDKTNKACSFYINDPPDKLFVDFINILDKIIVRMKMNE